MKEKIILVLFFSVIILLVAGVSFGIYQSIVYEGQPITLEIYNVIDNKIYMVDDYGKQAYLMTVDTYDSVMGVYKIGDIISGHIKGGVLQRLYFGDKDYLIHLQ